MIIGVTIDDVVIQNIVKAIQIFAMKHNLAIGNITYSFDVDTHKRSCDILCSHPKGVGLDYYNAETHFCDCLCKTFSLDSVFFEETYLGSCKEIRVAVMCKQTFKSSLKEE